MGDDVSVTPNTQVLEHSSAPRFWLFDDDLPFALAFVALCAFAFIVPAQSDTFYHLRSGRAMWEGGWFLERESFSHTAKGQPLQNHWWLSQLLFYGLYSAGGPVLVTVGAGACALAALCLSWRLVRATFEIRLLLGLGLILVFPQWSVRPQVFSMLMLMIVVRLVLADRPRWTLVPAVLLVWANAHALVVLGIVVPIAAAVEASVWSRHRLRPAILTAVAGAMVPMVSPLGWHYWPRAFETVRESRLLGIQEYRPAFSVGIDVFGIWLLFLVLVVMVARSASRLGKLEPGDRGLAPDGGRLWRGRAHVGAQRRFLRARGSSGHIAACSADKATASSSDRPPGDCAGLGGGRSGRPICNVPLARRRSTAWLEASHPRGDRCDSQLSRSDFQRIRPRRCADVVRTGATCVRGWTSGSLSEGGAAERCADVRFCGLQGIVQGIQHPMRGGEHGIADGPGASDRSRNAHCVCG